MADLQFLNQKYRKNIASYSQFSSKMLRTMLIMKVLLAKTFLHLTVVHYKIL